jgi:hypothetical protein
MTSKIKLSASNREFFRLVSEAAFSNPFSPERSDLDRRIFGAKSSAVDRVRDKAILKVTDHIAGLDAGGKADFQLYSGKDRELVRITLLFDVYYRFNENFDLLIRDHIKNSDRPSAVPFAKEAIALLKKRGFSKEESLQYFAFFYQIRRAFYFIDSYLVGQSPSIEKLRCHLWDNIFTSNIRWYENFLWDRMEDFSTFILGETGTGKGSAASAIGRSGFIPFDEKKGHFTESFTDNFISINLSQFPESLIESELFGHKKGAFTGAVDTHQGVFARCTPHGTIFLDEIGDVSVPVQIKLLQVLQERTFSAVGDHRKHRFNGRVIAATNRPLDELRKQGAFRDDFFYRLCSDIITIPTLRQRLKENPGELDLLLDHAIRRIIGEPDPDLLKTVKGILQKEVDLSYPWPGNVRELEQAVRRILLTRHYSGDSGEIPADAQGRLIKGINEETLDAQGVLSLYCSILYEHHGTYEEVARISNLDRRTVKKHIQSAQEKFGDQ